MRQWIPIRALAAVGVKEWQPPLPKSTLQRLEHVATGGQQHHCPALGQLPLHVVHNRGGALIVSFAKQADLAGMVAGPVFLRFASSKPLNPHFAERMDHARDTI